MSDQPMREMRSDELVEAMENLHQYPRLIAERAYAEGLAAATPAPLFYDDGQRIMPDDGIGQLATHAPLDDFVAMAQHLIAEHEATHGEAEMCGGECIVLGLTDAEAPLDDLREALVGEHRKAVAEWSGNFGGHVGIRDGWVEYDDETEIEACNVCDLLAAAYAEETK